MRLLMVEDDTLFGSALHKRLLRAGYAVDWIQLGAISSPRCAWPNTTACCST